MITKHILEKLQKNIVLYDEKSENDYLVLFSIGKNHECYFNKISFKYYNFWHLLGCKDISNNSYQTYMDCKNHIDISEKIELKCNISTFQEKDYAFNHVFDFVKNAKSIKIGYANKGPEKFQLTMALGNNDGIIGYDIPKPYSNTFLFPKSCQKKNLSDVSNSVNKILLILSKTCDDKLYTKIEYEIKKGIAKELIEQNKIVNCSI